MAESRKVALERVKCDGCRAERRNYYCLTCKMYQCSIEKGIDFCGECKNYPCDDLKSFQAKYPHRIELWESQKRIKEVGYEQWYGEQIKHYSCPRCGTLNSAYDSTCRKCGAAPSCDYVEAHGQEIIRQKSNIGL